MQYPGNATNVAGSIKFDSTVPRGVLQKIIGDLSSLKFRDPGYYHNQDDWIDLSLRPSGNDGTHYIAFHCKLDKYTKQANMRAKGKIFKTIRKGLGCRKSAKEVPTGVLGWSISNVICYHCR